MKNPRISVIHRDDALLVVGLAAALCLLLFSFGCSGGVPPATYCYQVVAATAHSVDTGMTVAGTLYAGGHLSENAKDTLVASHHVYQPALKAAIAGCKAVQDQEQADKFAADLQKAGDEMVKALVAVGVK